MEKKNNEEAMMMIHDEWESGLPSPDDLTPLTQSLITPQLASAFNIIITTPSSPLLDLNLNVEEEANSGTTTTTKTTKDDGWSSHHRVGLGGVKRPRLVWTPQLHKRFVDVIEKLGIERAVPKTIMEMMNVDGLTRENVASHLQKYRLYLKRIEGGEGNGGNNGNKGLGIGGGRVGNGYNVEMKHSMAPLMHMGVFGANGAGVPGGNFGYGGYCGLESGAYNNMFWNRQRG